MATSTLPSAEPNSLHPKPEKTGHKNRIQGGSGGRGRFRSRGRGSSNSPAHDRDRTSHTKSGARGNDETDQEILGQADTNGNDDAVGSDESAEIAQLKRRYRSQLATCRAIVPDWTDDDLLFVLQESSGEVETAISRIMEGHATQWGEVKKKKDKKKEVALASTGGFGEWPDTFSSVEYGAGRGRGRGSTDRPSRGIARGRGRGRASDSPRERTTSSDQAWESGGSNNWGTSGGSGAGEWDSTATNNGFGDEWGGANESAQKWDDPKESDSAPNVYDEPDVPASTTTKGRQQMDIQSTGGWSDSATKASSIAGGGDHGTEANGVPKSSIILPTSKSSWASILRPVVPPLTSTNDKKTASIASPLSENVSSVAFEVDTRPQLTSQNLETAEGLEDQPLSDSDERVLIHGGLDTAREELSTTTSKPVPTRSASYQRRLNQQAAVIMPSGAQSNPVERVGVQFGSLGLSNHREPEEINDVPRTSIQSPPRQYVDSHLHHDIGLPYSSRQAQAPQRAEEQNNSHIQGTGANLPPQLNRFGGSQLPPVPSHPQPQRSYDPFGSYGGYSLPQAQSAAGYGGHSQQEEYQDQYRQDPQKGSFNNYHQQSNYGQPPSVPSTASLEASKPTHRMSSGNEESESRYFPQSPSVDGSNLHPTLSSHGSGHYHAPSPHQLSQQSHQPQAPGFPVQQQYYNPYAYYMNPQYGYGYGQQFGNKQAPFNQSYAPHGNYGDGQTNFASQSRGASASEYGRPQNPGTSNAQIPEFLHSEYGDSRGINEGDVAQAGDRRSSHAGANSRMGAGPNNGQHQPQYGQQHQQSAQPGYSMYSGGFGGYASPGGAPQQQFQQAMHRQQSQEHAHHSPQPQMANQRPRNAHWGQYGAQN